MKKTFLMSLLAAAALTASAEQVTETFSGCVSSMEITPPEGWGIVPGTSTWNWSSTNGLHGNWIGGGSAILVSPVLDGPITFEYKCDEGEDYGGYGGEIYLYEMTPNGDGTYVTGNQLSRLTYNTWQTVSKTVGEGKCLGFKIEDANIRNVKYTPVTMETDGCRLTVSSMTWGEGVIPMIADYEGNVPFTFSVNVNNTGGQDIAAGDPNAILSFGIASAPELAQFTLPEALAVGENKTFTFSGSFPISAIAEVTELTANRGYYWCQFQVKEPFFNQTTKVSNWNEVYPRGFQFDTRLSGSENAVDNLSFGFASPGQTVTKSIILYNKGVEPLENVIVTVPEGYYLTETGSFNVPAVTEEGHSHTIEVNLGTREGEDPIAGIIDGDMMIYVGGAEEPLTVHLSGVVADEDHFFESFEGETYPAGWLIDPQLKIFLLAAYMQHDGDTHALDNNSSSASYAASAITPRLSAQAGDKLLFQAGSRSTSSADSWIKVYYSTDRNDWNLVKTIRNASKVQEGDESFSPIALGNYSYDSDMNLYTVDMPEGEGYLRFEILYARMDNVFGCTLAHVDHDLMFTNVNAASMGKVNNPVELSFNIKNIAADTEEAGTYTLHLMANGQEVNAMTETPEIPAGETNFRMNFYPHQEGEVVLKAQFRSGNYMLETPEMTVTVTPETLEGEAITGDKDTSDTPTDKTTAVKTNDGGTPFNFYYKSSMSQMLYTEEYLTNYGIMPGTTITGMNFFGYCTETSKTPEQIAGDVRVWIIPTELTAMTNTTPLGVQEDKTIELPAENLVLNYPHYVPTFGGTQSNPVALLNIDFATPYEYNGGNIIVIFETIKQSSYTSNWYTLTDANTKAQTIRKHSDTYQATTGTSDYLHATFSQGGGLPKTSFHYAMSPAVYSGTVENSETHAAVANADITLTSGDVLYSGTTDGAGAFSIEVIQADKEYNVTVAATDYNDYTGTVSFADGNVTDSIQLVSTVGSGVSNLTADGLNLRVLDDMITVDADATLRIFATNGTMLSRVNGNAISTRGLAAGLYILTVESAQGNTTVRFVKK